MITHDSWKRIKEIFQSAQELTPAERSDFLDETCGDDQSLREEVEALLIADAGNETFLSAPAYEFAAGILAGEGSEFLAKKKIGRYTILCSLGSGGMGQIYLAEDEELHRKIALKLIAPQFANDARRVHRFEQEARAASALNHPNICVIHEIGTTEAGRHFIAMEYIQGITLRDQLSRGALSVRKALNIAIQVATALASAHATGIVHRDIKPENIMLRPDGYVKVLDFGLAKLTEIVSGQNRLAGISTNVLTETGMLMGTVKYMSPEQLREVNVDERTDIWSLGVVLYEMLTGVTPFEARSSNDTVAAILAPQTPLRFPVGIPRELQDSIAKALGKDRDARYQTITKFATDLRKLQNRLQREADSESVSVSAPINEQQTRKIQASRFLTYIKSQAITGFIAHELRSHKAAIFAGATGILVLLLFLPSIDRFANKIINPTPAVQTREMTPVTNIGTAIWSAISSNRKWMAHAEEKDGNQRLLLTNMDNLASAQVVPAANVQYLGISFSRDNNYLYFTRKESGGDSNLYRLPVPGGTPVKIKEFVDSPISFSPQGDRFAFVRLDRNTNIYSLVVSTVDGSNERVLSTRKNGESLSVYGLAWSPDGKFVVCPTSSWSGVYNVNLIAFDSNDGTERSIGNRPWFAILQMSWQEDMSSLVLSARDEPTAPFQLWRVTYPDGVAQNMTMDLADYRGISLSGNDIVTVRIDLSWELIVAGAENNYVNPSSIASGAGLNYGVGWAGNKRIVFSSMVHDTLNISRIDADGSNQVTLTEAENNYTPGASTDGRVTVFSSNRGGTFNIWRMNTEDGSDLKQLTFTNGNFYPAISPDNQWIAYDNQEAGILSVWKAPLDGGAAIKLAERYRMPAFSPDGRFIAMRYDGDSGSRDLAIFSAQGGEPLKRLSLPNFDWQRAHWISNEDISYIDKVDGYANIWSQNVNTGAKKQLTNFNRKQIFAYAWSPDFKLLACQLGTRTSNVVRIR
jgi:serine/threonine protein kinase